MNKDFIYEPLSRIYLNINHITSLRILNGFFRVITTEINDDGSNAEYEFNTNVLKHFEPITGALVPIKE